MTIHTYMPFARRLFEMNGGFPSAQPLVLNHQPNRFAGTQVSLALLNLAKIISRSTMLALFRAWCARDSFRYLDFFEEGGL